MMEQTVAETPQKTILIIDDEYDFRLALVEMLDLAGYHVVTSSNGEEALRILDKKGIHPDLILLDLNMPKMNGNEFLSRLKQREGWASIPVIVITGDLSDRSRLHFLVPTILKPVNMIECLARIDKVLENKSL